jgi:hypothetical protein
LALRFTGTTVYWHYCLLALLFNGTTVYWHHCLLALLFIDTTVFDLSQFIATTLFRKFVLLPSSGEHGKKENLLCWVPQYSCCSGSFIIVTMLGPSVTLQC